MISQECIDFLKKTGCDKKSPSTDLMGEAYTLLDPMAEMFVAGCTIDYVTELGGAYLKVINPNATASCGCGESFAV